MYDYLSIGFDVAPCAARCFHCSYERRSRPRVRAGARPWEQLAAIAERYIRHRGTLYKGLGLHINDSPLNYHDIVPFTKYARDAGAIRGIPVNGARARDYAPVLQALADLGEDWIQISLYGLEPTHDRLAGRKGDFKVLDTTARAAAAVGFKIHFRVFVSKENINELGSIAAYVDGFGDAIHKHVWDMWVLAGRGLACEDLRIDEADRAAATEVLPENWFSEREIIVKLVSGELNETYFSPRVNMLSLSVGPAKVFSFHYSGRRNPVPFPVEDDGAILAYLEKEQRAAAAAIARVPELAREFGDAGNTRLYNGGAYRQLLFARAGLAA